VKGYLVEYGGMPATYRITKSATSVNEGSAITFNIYTNNVEWNSYLTYSLTGIAKSDLSSGELSGTAQVLVNGSEGLATLSINLAEDYFTDGPETLTLNVSGTTSSVVVLDTSKTPNYAISSSAISSTATSWRGTITVIDSSQALEFSFWEKRQRASRQKCNKWRRFDYATRRRYLY
jgi:hypothetical protein